jgi:Flp pilus assembly protein TadB
MLAAPTVWKELTSRYVADLSPTLRILHVDESRVDAYLRWWGIALFLTLVIIGFVLRMLPVALLTMYLIYIAPRLLLKALIRKRQLQLRDQLVGATVALANTARAGMSLAQGLETVANESPRPLSDELKRIVHEHKKGLPLPKAISQTKTRLNLEGFTLFSAALLTCLERGGRITDALDRISRSLAENQRIERRIESETAAGRKVVRILTIFPAGFLALFVLLYPQGTLTLFTSTVGQIVLSTVICLVFIAVRWSNQILTIEI